MDTEVARQTFSKFHSNHQNCRPNEPKHYRVCFVLYEHLSKLEINILKIKCRTEQNSPEFPQKFFYMGVQSKLSMTQDASWAK